MIRRTRRRELAFAAGGLALAALAPSFASCALSEMGESAPPDASTLPAAEARGPTLDAAADSACDAASDDCTPSPLSCEDADFCPTPTNVSAFYALTAVSGSGPGDVWAVGSGGTIIHWDGVAWTATPSGVKETLHAVWAISATEVWTAGATNVILSSTGFAAGSATWARTPAATEEFNSAPVFSMWGTSEGALHLGTRAFLLDLGDESFVAMNQLVRGTVDGGAGFRTERGTATVNGIWGASPDDVWVVGDNSPMSSWQLGLTMHGTRSAKGEGLTWQDVDSQASVVLESVWGSSAGDVWAVGDKGTLRRITAGAPRWEVVASPTTERLHHVWGSGPKDIWAVGDVGTILHYDGVAWSPATAAFPPGKKPDLHGVWGSGPSDVWIVGDGIAMHATGRKAGARGGAQ